MSDDVSLQIMLAKQETELKYLKDDIKRLEQKSVETENNAKYNTKEIASIKLAIQSLTQTSSDIKASIDRLNNNVFLQFTSDIDLKKFVTILITAATFISSPTILQTVLNAEPELKDSQIDKIIDLLEGINEQP